MFWLLAFTFTVLVAQSMAWTGYGDQYPAMEMDHPYNVISAIQRNDLYLADTINDYVFHHLERGQFSNPSGWGYPYSRGPISDPAYNCGPPHWTPFEQYGSFYTQRNRFPYLSALARERLQMQGLQVRGLNIFDNNKGIYIKWDIVDPSISRFPNARGTCDEEYFPIPSEIKDEGELVPRKKTWCDGDPSTGMCRLEQMWKEPRRYFCSGGPLQGFC